MSRLSYKRSSNPGRNMSIAAVLDFLVVTIASEQVQAAEPAR